MDKLDLEPVDNQPLDLEPLDLEPVEPPKEVPSTAEDALIGTGQGISFGTLDEIISAIKTPELAKLFWQLPKDDVAKQAQEAGEKYRAQQQIEQQKVAEARERSPYAFTAGELAGGILPALFTGGATAAASGAKAAATGARAAAGLPSLLTSGATAATEAKAAAGFLPSVTGAIKAGAGYGALSAAGTTEKPIEETGEFLGEVGKGALAGGVIGGALSGLGALGRAIKPDTEEYAMLRQAKLAFEEAKGEAPAFGESAVRRQVQRETDVPEALTSQLMKAKEAAGKEMESVLKKSDMPLYSEDFSSIISMLGKDIPPTARKFLVNYGQKLKQGTLTASELNEVKKILKETTYEYRDKLLPKSMEALKALEERTESLLKTVKGYEKAVERYNTFLEVVPETITEKGVSPEFRKRYLSDIKEPQAVLLDEIKDLIRTIGKPGTSADERTGTMLALEKNIAELNKKDPELFTELGFDPKSFIETIKKEADISAISQARRGYEPQTGIIRQALNLLTPRGATYTAATALGKATGAIQRTAPAKLASKVYSAAEPELRSLSEKLISSPATRRFGESLAQSLDKPGGVPKRAILFSIMQSPEAREAIAGMYSGIGEE